jgi:hypothetical protein
MAAVTWNLTFADADAAAKDSDGDNSRPRVAVIGLGKVPAERLHPKAAY